MKTRLAKLIQPNKWPILLLRILQSPLQLIHAHSRLVQLLKTNNTLSLSNFPFISSLFAASLTQTLLNTVSPFQLNSHTFLRSLVCSLLSIEYRIPLSTVPLPSRAPYPAPPAPCRWERRCDGWKSINLIFRFFGYFQHRYPCSLILLQCDTACGTVPQVGA